MSQQIEGPRKTFTAGTALEAHRRVKITAVTGAYGPTVGYAGVSDPSIGVTEEYTASGAPVTIYLANAQGTRKMMATAAAITGNNPVYAAASGYVASTGTIVEGKALESTAGASGDILEVLPVNNSDISTAIAGTTNASFTADNDAATPKIALAGQTAGTGDFTTTLKPEAALVANTYVIVPETTDGDTLMALALAQTVTGKKTFSTADVELNGAIDLVFNGTTGQPEVMLQPNLADALSVKSSAGDIAVVDTSTGAVDVLLSSRLRITDSVASGTNKRVGGLAYAMTAAGTAHTNSTDEAVLGSYTIPANTLKAGSVLKVRYQGIATATNGADTLTVNLRIGATTLTGTVLITHAATDAVNDDIFAGEFTLVARAAPGAAAACVGVGSYAGLGAAGTPTTRQAYLAATNLATNGALLLEVTADWSAASAADSCRLDVMVVEII